MFIYSPPFTSIHVLNLITQLSFDYMLMQVCGGSFKPVLYLLFSSFLAGSLHPCAGHFIAEHYFFSEIKSGGTESMKELAAQKDSSSSAKSSSPLDSLTPPETYSYYGPLNILTYNVGLHNEHHDFPAIPWTRLPEVYRIAREFYEPLPCHRSWVWVIWAFILDQNVGLWCRVKRAKGGRVVGGLSKRAAGRGGEGISAASVKEEEDDDEGGWKESEIQN